MLEVVVGEVVKGLRTTDGEGAVDVSPPAAMDAGVAD